MKQATAKMRGGGVLVWVLTALVIAFVIWARNAPLDEIVRGSGEMVPSSQAQVVQSLEGGILDELRVAEGDNVEQGQTIASLSKTRYLAEVRDLESQILTIEAKLLRLRAELDGINDFALPARFRQADASLSMSEEQLFKARQLQHQSERSAAEAQVTLTSEKVGLLEEMVNQGAVPPIDLLNAKVAAEDALAERNTLVSRFALERSDEISALVADLARLEAQISQSRDQLERSDLVSPVDGVVNKVLTTTLGGVIQPGEEIFEIIPRGDQGVIELRPGMQAEAEVHVGEKTVMQYLITPLVKSQEALREP